MSKLTRFEGYNPSEKPERKKLPAGGYVAGITKVWVEPGSGSRDRLCFWVEIDEGPYGGFFTLDYRAQEGGLYAPKYRGHYAINIPNGDGSERDTWAKDRFNRTIAVIEASNPGFQFDFDTDSLLGLKVGIVVREAVYNSIEYTEIGGFESIEKIRNGTYRRLKKRGDPDSEPARAGEKNNATEPVMKLAPPEGAIPVIVDDIPF